MKLSHDFFARDCLAVAPDLVGKWLVHNKNGECLRLRITETEAYRGEEDTACHAHKGRTARTEMLYRESGTIYIYLCYGMHWLLNVVTGEKDAPQAVLIRACETKEGPAKLTKFLGIDKTLNGENIVNNGALWIESDEKQYEVLTDKRVGIGYASEQDQNRLWRFKMGNEVERRSASNLAFPSILCNNNEAAKNQQIAEI